MARRLRHVIVREQPPVPNKEVPARVYTAMHFIEHFTHKTEIKALPVKGINDSLEYQPLEKIELTEREKDTYDSALSILEDYFDGSLKESQLERMEFERREEMAKKVKLSGGPILVLSCPQCMGGPRKESCLLCRTKGVVTVGMVP